MFSLFRRSSARTAPKARLGLESLDGRDMPSATLASAGALPAYDPSHGSVIGIGSTPLSLARYSDGGIIIINSTPAAVAQKV
jgi:hypothetical protein